MAYMWISDANQKWEAVALSEEAYDLRNFPSLPRTFAQAAVVMKIADGAPGTWAVMAGGKGEVYLNGHPIIAGLAILADRDEIRINGSSPLFFSTETLASVQALPGADRPIFCGRCRQQMKPGCPRCNVRDVGSGMTKARKFHVGFMGTSARSAASQRPWTQGLNGRRRSS